MGYRVRIGRISKSAHEKYGHLKSSEEVEEAAGVEVPVLEADLPEYQEILEIGKYVDYSEGSSPFFSFELEETEFSIVTREWLLNLIDDYHNRISSCYEEFLKAFVTNNGEIQLSEELNPETMNQYKRELFVLIERRSREWNEKYKKIYPPYHLEPGKDGPIVAALDYEYQIFNLIHILHTFDWKNDLLIYSGW